MIDLVDLLQALLLLGLPMVILSWCLFSWMFESGELDRGAGHKAISSGVKALKKNSSVKTQAKRNLVFEKWMWFGSGFYGLAGLWTFSIIELRDFLNFLLNLSQLSSLAADGLIDTLIDVLISQLGNVLQAFLWFSYWPADSILAWIVVAYLGYWLGVELAKRRRVYSLDEFLQKIRAMKSSEDS